MSVEAPEPSSIRFTPFVREKVRVWFKMLDVRKEGYMSRASYEQIADRFAAEYNLDDERAKEISDWLIGGWEKVMDESSSQPAEAMSAVRENAAAMREGERISEDRYVEGVGELIRGNSALARSALERMVGLFFDVFDFNRDGYISLDEMIHAMKCFGVEDSQAVENVFRHFEAGHPGRISRTEYVNGWLDFILGDDRSNPLTRFFAPHLLAMQDDTPR